MKTKTIIFFCMIFIFFFGFHLSVFALENDIVIKSVELHEISDNAVENSDPVLENNQIQYDLLFHDTGDYVTYKIVIENNTNSHYIVDTITDNNSNSAIQYEYLVPNSDLNKNSKTTFYMKVNFKNDLPGGSSLDNGSYRLNDTITSSIHLKDYIINPHTFSSLSFFILILSIVIIMSLLMISKKKLALLIFALCLATTTYSVSALGDVLVTFTVQSNVEVPVNFIDSQWRNKVDGNYNKIVVSKNVDIPQNSIDISEHEDGSIRGWIDSDGTLYFASQYRMYLPSDSSGFFNKVSNITEITFDDDSISSIFAEKFIGMFAGLSQIEEINTSWIKTENATNLSSMFSGCTSLKELDLHGWTNPDITHIYSLLSGATSLERIDLSNWDNHKLNGIMNFSGFGSSVLKELNLKNFDISNFTSLQNMFSGFYYEYTLDLSSWDFSNVSSTIGMFSGANIKKLVFGDSNFSSLTDASSMFGGTSVLEIDFGEVDSPNLVNATAMFSGTYKISKLDLSSWDFSNVTNMGNMFGGNWDLEELIIPNSMPSIDYSIRLAYIYQDEDGNTHYSLDNSISPGAKLVLVDGAFFDRGSIVNMKLKKLAGNSSASYSSDNSNIVAFVKSDTLPNIQNMNENNVISAFSNRPIYAWFDNGTIYYYSEYDKIYAHSSSDYMFYKMLSLSSIDTSFDTSGVQFMESMFYAAGQNASSFSMDISDWDVSRVTSISSMFFYTGRDASSWSIGDLSNWNTSNVTKMDYLFSYSGRNSSTWNVGNLGNWDVSNVTTMRSMFDGAAHSASSIIIGDLSNWDTSKVTSMYAMFYSFGYNAAVHNFGTLHIYNANTHAMFRYCRRLNLRIVLHNTLSTYTYMFTDAATDENAQITIDYYTNVANIGNYIATKSSNSHVVYGNCLT